MSSNLIARSNFPAQIGQTGSGRPLIGSPFFHFAFAAAVRSADPGTLRALLGAALRRRPAMPFMLLQAFAERCVALGQRGPAIAACRLASALEPRLPDALATLLSLLEAAGRPVPRNWSRAAKLLGSHANSSLNAVVENVAARGFDTVDHYSILAMLGEILRPAVYLEVGVDGGGSLAVCHAGARMIGVDPEPRLDPAHHPGLELFRTTSDAFFAGLPRHAPDLRFDLAFLDGLHEAGQLLRDFRETERLCRAGGCIVLHDVLPVHPASAEPTRRLDFWVGDCWRLLCLLAELRPDLDVALVNARPSGLAVIRGLDPDSRRLFEDEGWLYARLAAFDLGADFVPTILRLPWVEPDRDGLAGFLSGHSRQRTGWTRFDVTAADRAVLAAAGGGVSG